MTEIVLTSNDANRSLSIHVGDRVVIHLPENPTTGYRWSVERLDTDLLDAEGPEFSSARDAAIGGGGTMTMRLVAKKPGSTSVVLANRRAWETSGSPIDRFEVMLQITS